MASTAQREFFDNLLDTREFPAGVDRDSLRQQFGTLETKNASGWIENAKKLPMRDTSDSPVIPPPF